MVALVLGQRRAAPERLAAVRADPRALLLCQCGRRRLGQQSPDSGPERAQATSADPGPAAKRIAAQPGALHQGERTPQGRRERAPVDRQPLSEVGQAQDREAIRV